MNGAYAEELVALRTPRGRVVTVSSATLASIIAVIEDARSKAFDEVVSLLDDEFAKMKDRGDQPNAELIEVLRAKIRAKK